MKGVGYLLGLSALACVVGCSSTKAEPVENKPVSILKNVVPTSAPPSAGIPLRPWFGGDKFEYAITTTWTEADQTQKSGDGTYVETFEWKAYEGQQAVLQHCLQTITGYPPTIDRDAYWAPGPIKRMIAFEDRVAGGGMTPVDASLKTTGERQGANIQPNTAFHWSESAQDGTEVKHGIEYGAAEEIEVAAGKFACIHRRETYESGKTSITDDGSYCPALGAWVKRKQESSLDGATTTEYELTSTSVDPAAPWPSVPAVESKSTRRIPGAAH